jgi:hypothetical protein
MTMSIKPLRFVSLEISLSQQCNNKHNNNSNYKCRQKVPTVDTALMQMQEDTAVVVVRRTRVDMRHRAMVVTAAPPMQRHHHKGMAHSMDRMDRNPRVN